MRCCRRIIGCICNVDAGRGTGLHAIHHHHHHADSGSANHQNLPVRQNQDEVQPPPSSEGIEGNTKGEDQNVPRRGTAYENDDYNHRSAAVIPRRCAAPRRRGSGAAPPNRPREDLIGIGKKLGGSAIGSYADSGRMRPESRSEHRARPSCLTVHAHPGKTKLLSSRRRHVESLGHPGRASPQNSGPHSIFQFKIPQGGICKCPAPSGMQSAR